jgi:Asp-tRNA(Asn)/Glu-tRNA(Gln) amidotransferase A subunit family amidase
VTYPEEFDLLDELQTQAEASADAAELTGVNRRQFVFRSLVGAAAGVFGLGAAAAAAAQTPAPAPAAGGGQGAATPTPPPLGMGDPVSWTFQPHPHGIGAVMEKLIRERGAAAFERSTFTVAPWTGPVPTSAEDLAFLPAHRLSALIKARRITSTQITRIYLDRLKKYDPALLCVVTMMEEQALAEAARADAEIAAGKYRGPLHGVPYGVKDLFSTKGVRTTYGSRDFENQVIDEDAEVVVRLRNAGAVLLAKLSTGMFAAGANWYRGRTNNPWDVRRGSSGSSAGPSSATAAGCVAFGIGTETSGSIVSPARECGLSALRPTFGRVSRHGGMVLAWSQDRVGPICRTIEDCAMVFNVIHGTDPKDPGTLMVPFQFDRAIKLATLRIGVDANAPKEFVDALRDLGAKPVPIGARPTGGGGGLGVETAAAFDFYVQAKAKEFNVDLASLPEPPRGGGAGRGGRGAGAGDPDAAAAGDPGAAGRGRGEEPPAGGGGRQGRGGGAAAPTGMASVTRFTNGRFPRAFDFIQQQRRRYMVTKQMHELLKDFDMYVPGGGFDVGLHAQTGHPAAVVQYKFEPQAAGGGGRGGEAGRGGAGAPPAGAAGAAGGRAGEAPAAQAQPPITYNPQPICAVICGNLYNDDKILSVAHQYQMRTSWHTKRPALP